MQPTEQRAAAEVMPQSLLDKVLEQQASVASRYRPVMSTVDFTEREKAIAYLVEKLMIEGVDYGWVPGTRPTQQPKPGEYAPKPTLFKAGAEKACSFFGYVPHFEEMVVIEEWTQAKYGEALYYYKYRCQLAKDGAAVGEGIGSATTWESKYRYRNSERTCPECGKSNIRKSKPKPSQREEPGFYCWDKTGGCGATFPANDDRITGQEVGKMPNPDIADVINTVQKMGQKRAYVAATLTATGLSGRFTQDLEDLPTPPQSTTQPTTAPAAPPSPKPPEPSFEERFRAANQYQRLNVFKQAKARYAAVIGQERGEARYYDHLQAAGVSKSNEFIDIEQALACASAMIADVKALEDGTIAFGAEVPPPAEDWNNGRE